MKPNFFKIALSCICVLLLISAIFPGAFDLDNDYEYSSTPASYSSKSYNNSTASYSKQNSYSASGGIKTYNSKTALTKEQADALRGTGYNGTRPNSAAETMELAAAQVTCYVCGMHTSNGGNSACNACRANGYH